MRAYPVNKKYTFNATICRVESSNTVVVLWHEKGTDNIDTFISIWSVSNDIISKMTYHFRVEIILARKPAFSEEELSRRYDISLIFPISLT